MKMRYMLDTNICIYIAKKKPPEVLQHFKNLEPGEVGMSVVTYGELYTGACKSNQKAIALQKLERIHDIIPAQAMSSKVGQRYGELRGLLELSGAIIGNNDLWIAAHALDLELVLVSNNQREFERVPGLALENWASDKRV